MTHSGDAEKPSEANARGPSPIGPGNMKLRRQRDNQQWILDYLIKATGRDRHFFYDGRKFPAGTRSYAMIPRQMARAAEHKHKLARSAEDRGHRESALRLYHRAALDYLTGVQAMPFDDDTERLYLHDQLVACFDRIIELSPHKIERFEVPWEGRSLPGVFHHSGRPGAPTILHINGSDSTKELFPDTLDNAYTQRGFNVAVVDGPGQGEATNRKIRITPTNFGPAMSAAVDYLLTRPDVSADTLCCSGFSMGAFFSMKVVAQEPRFKALVTGSASYGSPYATWNQESPHFKRQFMFNTGIADEEEFDRIAEKFVLTAEELANIRCPVLMLHGEFDPMTPLEDAFRVYQGIAGPKEFWLTENDGHSPGSYPHFGGLRALDVMGDWLRDVLAGRLPPAEGILKVISERGDGPYGGASQGFWLPERLQRA